MSHCRYDQLCRRTVEEKEKISKEVFRVLEELINFKAAMENTISDLEQSVSSDQQEIK